MKTNRMRLLSLVLLFIVFGIGACAPVTPAAAPVSAPISTLSAIEACDVSKVDITDVHWFQEPDGAWRVVGMMHNNSDQPIAKVFADVETKDKNGESVYPESLDTVHPTGPGGEDYSFYPLNLLPGDEAPFSAWIKREIPNLNHFVIEKDLCTIAEPVERLQMQERGGQVLVDDNGMAQVTADVFNPTSQTALINGMMVGVFDAAGSLISAVNANVTPRILAPGEEGPVRASLALPPATAERVESYKLYMDALASDAAPILLDAQKDLEVSTHYVDTAGSFHLVGQITNPGTEPLMVSIQAAVYADQEKSTVVDAAFLDTLIPLAPGESMPFDLTDWQVLNNRAGLWGALSKRDPAIVLRVEPFRTWVASASVSPLTVIAKPPTFTAQDAVFTGEVKNETGSNILLGTVTVTLRDSASKKVIATGQASLDIVNALADGQTLGYSIAIPVAPGFDPQTVQFEITTSGQET